jgi:hypothetical protein
MRMTSPARLALSRFRENLNTPSVPRADRPAGRAQARMGTVVNED